MINLDTFRAALQAPPAEGLGGLDIDAIMAAGGRIRRRRLAGIAAAGALAVGLVAAAAGVTAVGGERQDNRPAAETVLPSTTAQPTGEPDLLGSVIPTGVKTSSGEVVLYFVKIESEMSDAHFGIAAGLITSGNKLRPGPMSNEAAGPDDAPGFHAAEGAIEADGVPAPEFGYYVGPAVKITGQVAGRTVRAHQATWSQDAGIVMFWFTSQDVPPERDPTGLTAYDADGQPLPSGDNSFHHG